MDYGTLRGIIALIIFVVFIIIVLWSYSKKRKASFDEAANSIFEEDHKEDTNKQETNNNV
ncbi:cbb3-type cytochrome oxidase subunit 3 [Thalassotalea piscium]